MRRIHSLMFMAAAILVAAGCQRTEPERTFNIPEGGIAFTMEGYAGGTKSVNVDASKVTEVETKITDANIWVFDSAGHYMLHSYSAVSNGVAAEKLFSANSAAYKIYVVANVGASLSFTPSTEADMKNLVAGFDNTKFNQRGLPAAGSGTYTPGGPTPFKLTRLVAKYKLTITDATAGGSKPYEFKFADGKVACRNVGKDITPFDVNSKPSEVFSNSDDIEFLSAAELAAIDSGEAVEKTLYLLENVWTSGATEETVKNASCLASYVEISGKGTIDKGAGHVYEKVTCRHLFGTDGAGKAGVVRNTLNTLSLSVTNDLLSENGWRVEASGEDFIATAAFSPAALSLTDDEEKTTTITPKDKWAENEDIEYVLETRQVSGTGKNVLIEVLDGSTWKTYTAGSSLKGTNTVRLVNANTKAGETKAALWAVAKLPGKSVDLGKADLDLIQVKGHYDFYWEQGDTDFREIAGKKTRIDTLINTGSKTSIDLLFSPSGYPLAMVDMKGPSATEPDWQYVETDKNAAVNFYALRDPVRPKETFTGVCSSSFFSILSADTEAPQSSVELHGGKNDDGNVIKHQLLMDANDGDTREGNVKFSFKEVCEQDPITVNIHQIGQESRMVYGVDMLRNADGSFYSEFEEAAKKVWAEGKCTASLNYIDPNRSFAWNHVKQFFDENNISEFCRTEDFLMSFKLKVSCTLTQEGNGEVIPISDAFTFTFTPKITTPTSATTKGSQGIPDYNFEWQYTSSNSDDICSILGYDDLSHNYHFYLGKESVLKITGFEFIHGGDREIRHKDFFDYYKDMQTFMTAYIDAVIDNFWSSDSDKSRIHIWCIADDKKSHADKYICRENYSKEIKLYKGKSLTGCELAIDSPYVNMGNGNSETSGAFNRIGVQIENYKLR